MYHIIDYLLSWNNTMSIYYSLYMKIVWENVVQWIVIYYWKYIIARKTQWNAILLKIAYCKISIEILSCSLAHILFLFFANPFCGMRFVKKLQYEKLEQKYPTLRFSRYFYLVIIMFSQLVSTFLFRDDFNHLLKLHSSKNCFILQ